MYQTNSNPVHRFIVPVLLVAWGMAFAVEAAANNVEANREGSLITVRGDSAGNDIIVFQDYRGGVVVRGLNGTTVNGQNLVRFNNIDLNQLDIRMFGGADTVRLSNLEIGNDLFVNLGPGSDKLLSTTKPCFIGANIAIEGDSGNEIISLVGWTIGQDLAINGQTGTMNAVLQNLTVGLGLTVIGDNSQDTVLVQGCVVGDTTSIETKEGSDQVTVWDHAGFDLFVNTDKGIDSVNLDNVVTDEDIGVFTGEQNDTVIFTAVTSGKNITVTLDTGNDSFSGTNVFAEFDAVFDGGDGIDTFEDNGVAGGEKTEIKEFEIFL